MSLPWLGNKRLWLPSCQPALCITFLDRTLWWNRLSHCWDQNDRWIVGSLGEHPGKNRGPSSHSLWITKSCKLAYVLGSQTFPIKPWDKYSPVKATYLLVNNSCTWVNFYISFSPLKLRVLNISILRPCFQDVLDNLELSALRWSSLLPEKSLTFMIFSIEMYQHFKLPHSHSQLITHHKLKCLCLTLSISGFPGVPSPNLDDFLWFQSFPLLYFSIWGGVVPLPFIWSLICLFFLFYPLLPSPGLCYWN